MVQRSRLPDRGLRSHFEYWREFLRQPRRVASVMASSRFLERRLVEIAEASQARFLVELGPGSGGTTRALLEAMPPGATLLAIEVIPSLARRVAAIRDRRLLVDESDALALKLILSERRLPRPDRIVSGIPFSSLNPDTAHRLMGQIHDALAPGGRFVAYQFRNAIVPIAESRFGAPEVFREFRNVPPLWIYRWRKEIDETLDQLKPELRTRQGNAL